MARVRIFAMDVDGTLTDGKIYMGDHGETMKAFNVKDGQGIISLERTGVITAIITVRNTKIVQNRAQELGIKEVYQNQADKVAALKELCKKHGVSPREVAYIGDDIGDLQAIRFCGLSFCPADAAEAVKREVTHILSKNGGDGAVREAAELLLRQQP